MGVVQRGRGRGNLGARERAGAGGALIPSPLPFRTPATQAKSQVNPGDEIHPVLLTVNLLVSSLSNKTKKARLI